MSLQFGMPGGLEMLVVFVVGVIVFGIPLVLIAVLGTMWLRADDDYDERIRELETEIARLQAEVGASDVNGSDGSGVAPDSRDDAVAERGADAAADSGGDGADSQSGTPDDR